MYSLEDIKLEASKTGYSALRDILYGTNTFSRRLVGQEDDCSTPVRLGGKLLEQMPDWLIEYEIPEGLETEFMGVLFESPLALASYNSNYGAIKQFTKFGLGGAATKSLMAQKRPGNPDPRHERLTLDGYPCDINSYALPSKGVIEERRLLENSGLCESGAVLILNIAGDDIKEYLYVLEKMLESPKIGALRKDNRLIIEHNWGCPNTLTGQNMCLRLNEAEALLEKTEKTGIPALVKIPPYLARHSREESDEAIFQIAKMCAGYENIGMTIANTIPVDAANPNEEIAKACCA